MINMLEYHKSQDFNNNLIDEKQENEKKTQNYKVLNISISLPKSILLVSEAIIPLIDRKRNEIYNDFIVDELESYSNDLGMLIRFILKRSGLLEQLRLGINQYYNKEKHDKKLEDSKDEKNLDNFETIEISLKFPEILIEFVAKFCKISNLPEENFFSFLILSRFEYIYSDPQVLLNYVNNKIAFFEKLKTGTDFYYKNKKMKT